MSKAWIDALTIKTSGLLIHQPGRVFQTLTREFESAMICCALTATGGCRLAAARLLGISRNTITRKIKALELGGFATPSRHTPKPQPRGIDIEVSVK